MFNENNLISKSRPLLEMKNSGYNMGEFKILDTYLSRINPMKPETARVTFTKDEYCALLGVDSGKIRTKQLSKYTSHFLGNIVTIPRPDMKKGYIQKPLFTFAEYDEEAKEILLECNSDPQIFDMFFNVDNIGYVKYILRNVIHFKSMYSFKLFMLIKSKQPATEFTMTLDELRDKLEITAPRYTEFKFFNAEILKKVHREINETEKTDMRFDYELVKRARNTVAIKFKNIKIRTPVFSKGGAVSENDAEAYEGEMSTSFEFFLMDEIPEEVHEGDVDRARAINDIARTYIRTSFVDYLDLEEDEDETTKFEKISEATRFAAEECNERILRAIRFFNVREYNVRKKDIKTTAYAYYKAAFEGWLKNNA